MTVFFYYSVKVIGFGEIQIFTYTYLYTYMYIFIFILLCVFLDGQLPIHCSNDPLQRFKTQVSKVGFFSVFSRPNPDPFFFRSMTLTGLLGNNNQNSGSRNDRDDSRDNALQGFQLGTIKIQCHHGNP